uniref:Uncharacterized protein n=2 Tax=Oryza TaxID=4527 RepID=A0A0E0MUQ8_ORYRU
MGMERRSCPLASYTGRTVHLHAAPALTIRKLGTNETNSYPKNNNAPKGTWRKRNRVQPNNTATTRSPTWYKTSTAPSSSIVDPTQRHHQRPPPSPPLPSPPAVYARAQEFLVG